MAGVCVLLAVTAPGIAAQSPAPSRTFAQLESLFTEWRTFEEPPRVAGGIPDYSAGTNARRLAALTRMQQRLRAIDTGIAVRDIRAVFKHFQVGPLCLVLIWVVVLVSNTGG